MPVAISDPNIVGGALVFNGTRVPVRNLFDCLVAGDSIKEFLEDYPSISFEQVRLLLQSAEIAIEDEAGGCIA